MEFRKHEKRIAIIQRSSQWMWSLSRDLSQFPKFKTHPMSTRSPPHVKYKPRYERFCKQRFVNPYQKCGTYEEHILFIPSSLVKILCTNIRDMCSWSAMVRIERRWLSSMTVATVLMSIFVQTDRFYASTTKLKFDWILAPTRSLCTTVRLSHQVRQHQDRLPLPTRLSLFL